LENVKIHNSETNTRCVFLYDTSYINIKSIDNCN